MSEQAAIDKDEPEATPSGQSEDAQDDDLDSLLNEHEESQTRAQPSSGGDDRIDQIYQYIQRQEQKTQTEEANKSVSEAVKSIKEIAEAEGLDDDFVEIYLQGKATKDARLVKAYQGRLTNPAAWNAVLKMVAKEVGRYAPKADEDREAVVAAVRSGSTAKSDPEKDFPSEKEFKDMSDEDFNKLLKDVK